MTLSLTDTLLHVLWRSSLLFKMERVIFTDAGNVLEKHCLKMFLPKNVPEYFL